MNKLRQSFPSRIFVPRQPTLWMENGSGIKTSPPEVHEWVIGEKWVTWVVASNFPASQAHFLALSGWQPARSRVGGAPTLALDAEDSVDLDMDSAWDTPYTALLSQSGLSDPEEARIQALSDLDWYQSTYGDKDHWDYNTQTWTTRPHAIGDRVEIVRSTLDDLDDLFEEEPRENREDRSIPRDDRNQAVAQHDVRYSANPPNFYEHRSRWLDEAEEAGRVIIQELGDNLILRTPQPITIRKKDGEEDFVEFPCIPQLNKNSEWEYVAFKDIY